MILSQGQKAALHNLVLKKAGQAVGWINIGDALALTALGLATRKPAGWEVTPQGVRLAETEEKTAPPTADLLPFLHLV